MKRKWNTICCISVWVTTLCTRSVKGLVFQSWFGFLALSFRLWLMRRHFVSVSRSIRLGGWWERNRNERYKQQPQLRRYLIAFHACVLCAICVSFSGFIDGCRSKHPSLTGTLSLIPSNCLVEVTCVCLISGKVINVSLLWWGSVFE